MSSNILFPYYNVFNVSNLEVFERLFVITCIINMFSKTLNNQVFSNGGLTSSVQEEGLNKLAYYL